ncbi:MAG: sigma-70 family RNA polymerase sigma factor [Bacteroidota bacterium]
MCKGQETRGERLLFKKFYPSMFKLCLRYMCDEYRAKEVVSNGFVKVFKNLESFEFRDGNGLNAWIKKIMINESLMYLRKYKKFERNVSLEEVDENSALPQIDSIDAELIHQAIRSLPTGYRTVLNMYIIEGFSHKEIGAELNISENASRSQLTHARQKLQKILKGIL